MIKYVVPSKTAAVASVLWYASKNSMLGPVVPSIIRNSAMSPVVLLKKVVPRHCQKELAWQLWLVLGGSLGTDWKCTFEDGGLLWYIPKEKGLAT
jgi:hypothetical protein